MAEFEQLPFCCGINELGHVRDDASPEDVLMSFDWEDLKAHVIFSVTSSQTPKHAKGNNLAAFIKKHKLGPVVTAAKPAKNPGHQGTLKAWLWTPNKAAVKKWQAKVKKANPDKYGDEDYYYNPYAFQGNW